MITKIHCTNFERSNALDTFALGHIEQLQNTLGSQIEISSIKLWVKIENSFLQRGPDLYSCKVEIKSKDFSRVFSKERHADCYEAVKISIHEAFHILDKKRDQKRSKTRRLRDLFRRQIFSNS